MPVTHVEVIDLSSSSSTEVRGPPSASRATPFSSTTSGRRTRLVSVRSGPPRFCGATSPGDREGGYSAYRPVVGGPGRGGTPRSPGRVPVGSGVPEWILSRSLGVTFLRPLVLVLRVRVLALRVRHPAPPQVREVGPDRVVPDALRHPSPTSPSCSTGPSYSVGPSSGWSRRAGEGSLGISHRSGPDGPVRPSSTPGQVDPPPTVIVPPRVRTV